MVNNPQPRPGAFPPAPKRDRTVKVPTPPGGKPWRPGRTAKPDLAKSARLIMRMHPDLPELLDLRASEKGFSRAKLIEQILIGFLNSDPRNPPLSLLGKRTEMKVTPLEQRDADPHRFAARWQRYVAAHQALFGTPPPVDAEDPERFWTGMDLDRSNEPTDEERADAEVAMKRARKWASKK